MNKIYFSVAIYFLFSCSDNNLMNQFAYEIYRADSVIFSLDSTTSINSIYLQHKKDSAQRLYVLNKYTNTLYSYDFQNRQPQIVISLENGGRNGVGKLSGFYYHNFDSIFVYSYNRSILSIVNENGEIVKRSLLTKESPLYMGPSVGYGMPMKYKSGRVFFNCWGSNKEYYRNESFHESLVGNYEIGADEIQYLLAYPPVYSEGIWGIQAYQMYNSWWGDNQIVCSFPIDPRIYIIDLISNEVNAHEIKGHENFKVIPLSTKDGIIPVPHPVDEAKHYLNQDTYSYIYSDQDEGYIIRIQMKGISKEILEDSFANRSILQDASLIIFNENIEKIVEQEFSGEKYAFNNCFFANGGFYILRRDIQSEDIIVFDRYEIRSL